MAKNANLHTAKSAKNDEFYTRIEDIEMELKNYKDFFKGKVVFCNCGDAIHHNFGKYFSMKFEHLGLKKLICTSFEMDGGHGKVAIYEGDKNGNHIPDPDEWTTYELEGNGDFRSAECIELLKQSDVVVSNPPFSLFREYVAQLMEYNKKFLIIGNMNAITYKEIFPLIKENKVWLGVNGVNKDWYFHITDEYKEYVVKEKKEGSAWKMVNGEIMGRLANICWFTNIPHSKRNQPLDLFKKYNPKDYKVYDNYMAINVDKVANIPMDYDGVIGVPITFLDKYCPTQFEIVWTTDRGGDGKIENLKNKNWDKSWDSAYVNGKKIYKRIFIRKIV